jgi:hypothetical protein
MMMTNPGFSTIQTINPIEKVGSPNDVMPGFNPSINQIPIQQTQQQQQPIKVLGNPNMENRMMNNMQNVQQTTFQPNRPFQGEMVRGQTCFNNNVQMNIGMNQMNPGMVQGNIMGGPIPMNQQIGMNVPNNMQPNFQNNMMGQIGMQTYPQQIIQQRKSNFFDS